MVPQEVDDPVPEERHQVYKILRLLQVMVPPDEPPEVNGTFGGDSVFVDQDRHPSHAGYLPSRLARPG